MIKYSIALIIGSLRKDSFNTKLADGLIKLAPADFSFTKVAIGNLPLYNQDDDGKQPESVNNFKKTISDSTGLLFVTPEYNRSIPGVLKNAIDQGSRPYGQNCFAGKPAGVIGISIGTMGTSMSQQHLRNVLAYLDVATMAQPEAFLQAKEGFFDANGDIGALSKDFLQNWMNKYAQWIKRMSNM